MRLLPIQNISFTHKHLLKTYWLEGKIPNLKKGFYGGNLTADTATIEHLKPLSKGGKTETKNIVLAENVRNWNRGNKPLWTVFNKEAFETYCEEMKKVRLPYFNGETYVKQITKTIEGLLKNGQ